MTVLRTLALAALALLVPMAPGAARIHGQMYCWIDLEFPVPCEPYDDEEAAAAVRCGAQTDELCRASAVGRRQSGPTKPDARLPKLLET